MYYMFHKEAVAMAAAVTMDWLELGEGCRTENEEKQSSSKAEPGQAIKSAVA